jgi:hypothetical protein
VSHILSIRTEIRDINAISAACRRLKLDAPIRGDHTLYDGTYQGIGVKLPGWSYPIVIQENGEVKYDNYGGRWGNVKELNTFTQVYAVEKTKLEARKNGYLAQESTLADGSIRVTLSKLGG